jgi:hypothetical protein
VSDRQGRCVGPEAIAVGMFLPRTALRFYAEAGSIVRTPTFEELLKAAENAETAAMLEQSVLRESTAVATTMSKNIFKICSGNGRRLRMSFL